MTRGVFSTILVLALGIIMVLPSDFNLVVMIIEFISYPVCQYEFNKIFCEQIPLLVLIIKVIGVLIIISGILSIYNIKKQKKPPKEKKGEQNRIRED